MKLEKTLNIIIGLTLGGFSTSTRAQCPQICFNDNTFLGMNTGAGGARDVGIGELALSAGHGDDSVAVGYAALANSYSGVEQTAVGTSAAQFNTGNYNTGVGYEALYGVDNLSTGSNNTATGFQALRSSTTGNDNTATGYQAMFGNATSFSTGSNNTANGYASLYSYTTGNNNTASGYQALYSDTTGGSNTALGVFSLFFNLTGNYNTAVGRGALYKNTSSNNTAVGYQALNKNTNGIYNTALGTQALAAVTTNSANTAVGYNALTKSTESGNTAVGENALDNATTGGNNIAIGAAAGANVTSGSDDIEIGNLGAAESGTIRLGTVGQQTATYIAGIYGATVAGGLGAIIDSSGHLGTTTSSARYKEDIRPMDKASEAILSLQPVTFRYKKELDPRAIPQFGLVAEQVEKVNPDLVARDDHNKPYSVRYEAINAMLLNEFLKAHSKLEKEEGRNQAQDRAIAELKSEIETLTSKIKGQSNQP